MYNGNRMDQWFSWYQHLIIKSLLLSEKLMNLSKQGIIVLREFHLVSEQGGCKF